MSEKNNLPPQAKKLPHKFNIHGIEISDNYHWLRDKSWPKKVDESDIINYIEKENTYAESILSQSKDITNNIYQEILAKIPLEYKSCPVSDDGYVYYSISWRDKEYSKYLRYPEKSPEKEEVLLDVNAMSEGHEYFSIPDYEISHNNQLLAYSLDKTGEERFTIYVKDIISNIVIDSAVEKAFSGVVWDKDDSGFFYVEAGEDWRRLKVFYHKIGTEQKDDQLVYEESDHTFGVNIGETENEEYILLHVSSSDCDEVHLLDKTRERFHWRKVVGRELGYRCGLSQNGDRFYLTVDDMGKNFRLVSFPVSAIFLPEYCDYRDHYREEIGHDSQQYLVDIDIIQSHIAVIHSVKGMEKLSIYRVDPVGIKGIELQEVISMPDPCYELSIVDMPYVSSKIRYSYSSLRQPITIYEYDVMSKETKMVARYPMPQEFSSEAYHVERLWAKSRDGDVEIPISLIYHTKVQNQIKSDNPPPLLLYGYGSYGFGLGSGFRISIMSLLDRGIVYAVAHIRGGDDLGFEWYEQAKMLNKKRTFADFIDVADYLVSSGYASQGKITIHGGSAGGMLVGVCVNERPELYKAVIAEVPFVDVLNTMLDGTLSLTPGEYKEWGNPEVDKEYFDYIRSYSPYDNVEKKSYPHIFATAGINDPRVGYWEAAKWVAKLREFNISNSTILLKTDMGAGHGGKSGRLGAYAEIAEKYAFVVSMFGIMN